MLSYIRAFPERSEVAMLPLNPLPRRASLGATALGTLLLISACGLLRSRSQETDDESTSEVAVEVESHHWNDVVIYLMNGNQSRRLGTVAGVSTNHFVFPYRQLSTGGKIRLRAYPVGGQGSVTSDDLLLQPGQGVKWILESDLRRSSMSVF
jgi:hypothetical protein